LDNIPAIVQQLRRVYLVKLNDFTECRQYSGHSIREDRRPDYAADRRCHFKNFSSDVKVLEIHVLVSSLLLSLCYIPLAAVQICFESLGMQCFVNGIAYFTAEYGRHAIHIVTQQKQLCPGNLNSAGCNNAAFQLR